MEQASPREVEDSALGRSCWLGGGEAIIVDGTGAINRSKKIEG
jgi:hypothetical protein